uniref:Phosphoglycolate phosphatase n=1 Tax=Globodera rostochiensis TaxID=31243 RepID=A0A914I9I6_GLORO
MGATLSACSAAGCGKRCADQLGWIRSDADEPACSFSAEVYKLSADHRHWLKVHPKVLSLRVRLADVAVANDQHQQQQQQQQYQHMPGIAASGGVALLEAVGLVDGRRAATGGEEEGTTDRQPGKCSAGADDEDDGMQRRAALFTLPISEEAELKRYTEKFVYWRDPSPEAPVFGLNILSAAEADRFCAALRHLPPTPFLVPKWHRDEIVFDAHMAPLMTVHRGRLEECPTPLFTRCRVLLHERNATIGLTDELGQHVLAKTSTTECIFCLCPSPSSAMGGCGGVQLQPHRHDHPQLLSVSFPDRALLLQLPTRAQQLALCRHALRASAAAMAGAAVGGAAGDDDTARVARILRARLLALGRVMRKLNANDQTNGLIRVPERVEQEPVLLCDCEPAVAMRRRRAMFALLKYAMSTRIAALCDDAANKSANGGNNCSSELDKMLSSSHHFFPSPQNANAKNAIHVAHRVHLRAVLSCRRFSLQRTVQLLAKWSQNDDEWGKDGEEEEESGGMEEKEEEEEEKVKGTEEQQRRPHNQSEFSQIELNSRPHPLPSAGGSTPAQQLVNVLLELVESEQVFVHDMQTLLSLFVLPSRLSSLQCVRELCRTHRQFLGSLQTALGPSLWPPPSSAPSPEEANGKFNRQKMGAVLSRVGALFIAKSAQFKVYSKYTFAHSHFQRNREADADFNCLMVALSAPLGGTHALNSLLIKPVQRLCKYPLFLEQLHALCPPPAAVAALGGKTPAAECASICLKARAFFCFVLLLKAIALRQMRILANWLNEMVRIQEDYGAELASSSASTTTTNGATTIECEAKVALPSIRNALISDDKQQSMNGLNSLLLFSHVRWTNPPASSSAADDDDDQRQQLSGAAAGAAASSSCPSLNCVLFVFSTSIVVLERKRPKQQPANNRSSSSNKRLAPIVLPIARVLLSLIATSSSASGAACSSTTSSFVLAILPNPSSVPNTSSAPAAAHFLRFECFHPAVCRHLAQLLQHQTVTTAMAAAAADDGDEHPSMNDRMYEGQL